MPVTSHFYRNSWIFSFSFIFILLALLPVTHLQAGGWGKTEEVEVYEGTTWNAVYFDMNGLHYTASLPNYSSGSMQNGMASLRGQVAGVASYVIETSLNPRFTPPNSAVKFSEMIQKANSAYEVVLFDSKKFGAKFGVDLVPKKDNNTAYWRFLAAKNRLIKMGSDDPDENRRERFFESIKIQK